MRIFLDANILFSAAKSAGAVRRLLSLAEAAGHTLCADAYVAAEAHRNLQIKAPDGLIVLDAILQRIELAGFQVSALPDDPAAGLPDKDRPVLAAAVRLRCDALVTGDRTHFGRLYGKAIQGMTVRSPLQLAKALGLLGMAAED
ncbi:MAG TPA: PIN domain-containing protein [Burkholderiaceae bacterium]|nr:PIN domain-containing protein [Burkholderiaceae bacterium]